ncbi:hypothetical protein B0J11DRAFT_563156 [Dendryphion nanum]|uniref:Calponin-homology (CH) domain-containing protein n=1 Tax=Dendryphion nanum TaxID=256645 RepID=A0A9P9EET5_9PLEO|nr:hypothetical protein B0J11DRAFT_563156 [Dendryphion nanum]
MRRYAEATPCPSSGSLFQGHPYGHAELGRHSSIYAPSYSTEDNTTANLDYTTEFQPNLRNVKPRRPMRSSRRTTHNFNPSLDIFEDVAQEEEQQYYRQQYQHHEQYQQHQPTLQQQHQHQHQHRRAPPVEVKRRSRASIMPQGLEDRNSTILAQPAQKMPSRESQLAKPHRRRVSQLLVDRQIVEDNATARLHEHALDQRDLKKPAPRKEPRRRTIYVPSEDTTVVTIHPGQGTRKSRHAREASPDIGLDLVTLSEEDTESLVSVLKKEKQAPRKSIALPPKRGPLQQSARPVQSVTISEDRFGKGDGKENVPPGLEIHFDFGKTEVKKPAPKPARVHFSAAQVAEKPLHTKAKSKPERVQKRSRPQSSYEEAPAKSIKASANVTASATRNAPTVRSSIRSTIKSTMKSRLESKGDRTLLSSSPFHTDKSPPTALRRQRTERPPPSITMMHVVGKPPQPREKYPVLTEDLSRPELYEDHWLTNQEIAITQLLNSLFDSANAHPNSEQGPDDLRKKMLALYHEPAVPLLHKRLQASLQFGALSIPKDLLAQTLRLKDDVGMRKKFLNLWVKTYDLAALRAAVETIIGRQLNVPCRLSSGSTSSDDGSRQFRAERRAIESFLDTFLIRNEDAVRAKSGGGSIASIARGDLNGEDFGSQGWSWRRTALRSLMLVLLLDQAKQTDILPGCLFQTTSPHKTSTDVLQHLANMLLPSVGDITRPLHHMSYNVVHVQYPLQEHTYHIENIAIDLRDGILLARLVELLLFSPTTLKSQRGEPVTITMPNGEHLTSSFSTNEKENWVLSQHLKFPSIGRAQKLYNVQVALSALTSVRSPPLQATSTIQAEDIVDGHREKTLSFLWSLVGRCGLSTLVDWPQLVKETDRYRTQWYTSRDNYAQHDLDSDSDSDSPTSELANLEYHKRLLLSWSRSIARLHGLRVTNLTTSFSNPRILEAIVDTYLPTSSSVTPTTHLPLSAKLAATGCSPSFISLFTPHNTPSHPSTIPSRDFTLLTLTFLASRLLPISHTHRAACTIQRFYRLRLARREAHRRVVLMRVAAQCAVVARARERLLNATMAIQRRWRAVLEMRRVGVERDVAAFQALARGWAIRRWVRRVTAGRVGGKEKVRRRMGGW